MKAKDIMTREIVTVTEQTTIAEAMKMLIEKEISGAPVVNDKGEIIGLVTEKDLLVSYDFMGKIQEPVKDFMSREVVGIDADTPVEEISRLLVQKNIKRVPVLEGKNLLGIVSRRDVLKYILDKG